MFHAIEYVYVKHSSLGWGVETIQHSSLRIWQQNYLCLFNMNQGPVKGEKKYVHTQDITL